MRIFRRFYTVIDFGLTFEDIINVAPTCVLISNSSDEFPEPITYGNVLHSWICMGLLSRMVKMRL